MKQYTEYKDSRIEWIGKIPTEWEAKKLKYLFSLRSGESAIEQRCGECLLYGANGVIGNYPKANIFDHKVIIGRVGASGEINIAQRDSWISDNALIVDLFHRSHFKYIYYLLKSINLPERINKTAQPLITGGYIGNFLAPVTDFDEQEAIAVYLDRKTAQIDELIAKKERMVALLKEERTGIINQTVTKGLNPKAEMKESGIEWLGMVPKHWEIKKLKYLVKGKLEYGANEVAELDDLELPRYIRITDFDESGNLRQDTFRSLTVEQAKDYLLYEGDVLFARSGATVGKTFQFKDYTGKACFAGYLIKARPNKDVLLSDFLHYFTRSNAYENWKNSIFNQATIQNIGADKYAILSLPLPSLIGQKEIAIFINNKTAQIDGQVAREQKSIRLLKEYRAALISEVVTGKIDVRG